MNIYDIARLSGVSIATVSRVLNGSPKVSERTRNKVQAVMREQGYTPNPFARGLGLDSMKMVGVLCTDVADLFFAAAVSALERQLKQRGYTPVLLCTGSDFREKQKALETLLEKRVDAVILVGSPFREQENNRHIEAAARSVPVVAVNSLLELPNVYSVLCDEYRAVYDNTLRLAQGGCRRILYCYDVKTYSGLQKLRGYRDGLSQAGLDWDPSLEIQVEKSLKAAAAAAAQAAEQLGIDAAQASEDLLAAGMLQGTGGRLPVIGFNNSVIAQCTSPSLTSVDNRVEELCSQAVGLLEALFAGEKPPAAVVLEPVLVERDSCRFEKSPVKDRIL